MGPLASLKIVQMDAQGSASGASSFLASLGGQVLRIDRACGANIHHASFEKHVGGNWVDPRRNFLGSAKWFVELDLKKPGAAKVIYRLVETADIFIEGYRPGVAERLGIGPDELLGQNPQLIYLRATGWGQSGPLAKVPAHDINYLAIAGTLGLIGPRNGPPVPPLHLLGDTAGGLHAAFGALAAAFEARESGRGQVIDAAQVDTGAMFLKVIYMMHAMGAWSLDRGSNLMDGGAPFYGVYETADGEHMAVSAFEAPFYQELLECLGLANEQLPDQMDRTAWPEMRERFAGIFRTRTRAEWSELLENSNACVSPVLSLDEAPEHPHNQAREVFSRMDEMLVPATAPRFSRTPPPETQRGPESSWDIRKQSLMEWGYSESEIERLRESGIIG